MSVEESDVLIIGAGISGLSAAHKIRKTAPNLSVTILEAKARVGGRTLTQNLQAGNGTVSVKFDLGGQWVSSSQTYISALLAELGLETHTQFCSGRKLMRLSDNRLTSYESDIPSFSIGALLDLHLSIQRNEAMAKLVPVDDPTSCEFAADWDNVTVEYYLRNHVFTERARDVFRVAIRTAFGVEPCQLSLLYYLMFCNAAGGALKLYEIKNNGAQQATIKGGAQQVSERLAAAIGADNVVLNAPVTMVSLDQSAPNRYAPAATSMASAGDSPDTNPLLRLDWRGDEFSAGVKRLLELLGLPPAPDALTGAQAVSIFVRERLTQKAAEQPYNEKKTDLDLESFPLGVDLTDPACSQAVRILRLLHLQELRKVQTTIDEAIVGVQAISANPKTDQSLGQVGR